MNKGLYLTTTLCLVIVIAIFLKTNPEEVILESPFDTYLEAYEFSDITQAFGRIYAVGVDGLFDVVNETQVSQDIEYAKAMVFDGEKLWLGHGKGLSYYDGKNIVDTDYVDSEVNDLLIHNGRLYVASFDGLYIIDDSVRLLKQEDGLTDDMVNVLFIDNNLIYCGAYRSQTGGVAILENDEVIEKYTVADGLNHYAITSITRLNDFILIGSGLYTEGGLDILNEGKIRQTITIKDGLAGEKVRHIFIDDHIWVCSEYDGIALLTHQFEALGVMTTEDGLTDNECKMIYKDEVGSLWCAMRRGITKISDSEKEKLIDKFIGKGE